MYSVLLVDDEKYAVKGLAAGIDWDSMGFGSIYEAYDVEQAQELLVRQPVDIAILDIEMPGKSGLDLAEWLGEQNLHTELIFLTGHANFAYAQQALQMGAFRYLLKPVDYDDLAGIIKQVTEKIRTEREMLDYRTTYRKYFTLWESQKPLLVERFWQDVVQGRTAFRSGKLEPALREYDIPMQVDSTVLPVLISIEKWEMEFGARDEEIMEYAVRKAAEELVLDGKPGVVVAERSGSGLILFYQSGEGETEKEPEERLFKRCEAFIQSCNEYFHCRLSCYIGSSAPVAALSEAYQSLLEAERSNVTKTNSVLSASGKDEVSERLPAPPSFNEWAPLFEADRKEELEERAERYLRRLDESRVTQEALQAFYFGFAHLCIEAARKKGITYPDMQDIWGEVAATAPVKSIAALRGWTQRLIERHWAEAAANPSGQTSSVIAKVMEFVQKHPEEELGREQLAATVFLNPAYLSRLFRKETGQSLTEYILEVKINHAKQLLEQSNMKVGSVAEAIGYTHFSYFAKIFKKITGLSPHDYRKRYRRIL
jgi:two-component system, response regulator YesN